jgi:hypothetical protein
MLDRAAKWKTELTLRFEPSRVEGIAAAGEVVQDFEKIAPNEMFEHVAIVQDRAPAHRLGVERRAPKGGDEGAQQQLLGETHARIRRHLERTEFNEPEPAGRTVG